MFHLEVEIVMRVVKVVQVVVIVVALHTSIIHLGFLVFL